MSTTPPEDIADKVTRLAWELSEALNSYCDGKYHAIVHPSEKEHYAVLFAVTDAYREKAAAKVLEHAGDAA